TFFRRNLTSGPRCSLRYLVPPRRRLVDSNDGIRSGSRAIVARSTRVTARDTPPPPRGRSTRTLLKSARITHLPWPGAGGRSAAARRGVTRSCTAAARRVEVRRRPARTDTSPTDGRHRRPRNHARRGRAHPGVGTRVPSSAGGYRTGGVVLRQEHRDRD